MVKKLLFEQQKSKQEQKKAKKLIAMLPVALQNL
jgi:hypothetical protein